jgi:hypothetical protein
MGIHHIMMVCVPNFMNILYENTSICVFVHTDNVGKEMKHVNIFTQEWHGVRGSGLITNAQMLRT